MSWAEQENMDRSLGGATIKTEASRADASMLRWPRHVDMMLF